MPCDLKLKPRQTISERAVEVRRAVELAAKGLAAGRVRAVVDAKTGAVAFDGLSLTERDGITDACLLRRLMGSAGSALAKAALARAEMLAGRAIDKRVMTIGGGGTHSHDGGRTFHGH